MKQLTGNNKLVVVLLLSATAIASCKKDHTTPGDMLVEKELIVNFQNSLISVNDIDSANVVFRKNGTSTPIFQRFQKGTNQLHTVTDGLSTGQWLVELDLYTKKDAQGKSAEYILSKTITLTKQSDIVEINGPINLNAGDWKKRMVLATTGNDIVAIIPEDITDPYFEFRTKNVFWNFFAIERNAYFGNAVVGSKQWQCSQGCIGNDRLLYNKDFFKPFTDKVKTQLWNRSDIIITVGNLEHQQYNEFNYNWAR